MEKILLELQLGIQSARFHSSNKPRVDRTNADQWHRQQRLLLSLHLPDLVCIFHRLQRSVFQLCGSHVPRVRTVSFYIQSPHISRDSLPPGGDGAPIRIVVQVRFPLDHLWRCCQRRVLVVGCPHQSRVVARCPEPCKHPPDLTAHRDASSYPLPAEWLQPGLLLADALGV